MGQAEKSTAIRIGRGIISVGIAELGVYLQGNPYLILLAPMLSGLGKFLRSKLGMNWVPF